MRSSCFMWNESTIAPDVHNNTTNMFVGAEGAYATLQVTPGF